ncbi:putative signal peptide protein [Puccinia sorghi]|uniref:Putative signal peptide protein n=1 Tax=Puccinia sorghi TaxID=27349 RepID=A0A0L6UUU5_9BASI|nr:putative signal peptide protein [Puccinia sorghi]
MPRLRQSAPAFTSILFLFPAWIGSNIFLAVGCSEFPLPQSPSGDYEPSRVPCPSGLRVRVADQYPVSSISF